MSKIASRPDSQLGHRLELLQDYLLHYDTKWRTGERHRLGSRSTVYRQLRPFFTMTVPPLSIADPSAHTALMLDGFYVAYPSVKEHRHLPGAKTDESILLLAIDASSRRPLHWRIYRRLEDGVAWELFFAELVRLGFHPRYLIHDGHYGIRRAANRHLPGVLHQRCLVHMVRNVHKDIGITPKAPLARQLQTLIYQLVTVRTYADKATWNNAWRDYLTTFSFAELTNVPRTKAFLSLHTVLMHAYERDELFTFLDHPGLPRDTNAIESRNRVLREALRRHRGMNLAQREALVSWVLLFKSTDDLTAIRAHYLSLKDTLFDA